MMSKELCFKIEKKNVYMEQILVDYMDVPIFFLCKDKKQFYIVLCSDVEKLVYIVEKISSENVRELIHGYIPMRDVFYKEKEYWEVVSGEKIDDDIIVKKSVGDIDTSALPEEGACFKALTEEILSYIRKFDENYFSSKYYDNWDVATIISKQIFITVPEQKTVKTDVKIPIEEWENSEMLYDAA